MTQPSFADIDLDKVDLTDLAYFQDGPPHALFDRMRIEANPHWNSLEGDEPGFWSFTRWADIHAISTNPAVFSSARNGVFATTRGAAPVPVLQQVILGMDPPQHTKIRNIVQSVFTPKMIRQKESDIRATVDDLIDDVAERGSCDFVKDIAVELPLRVIADMLGVPQGDRRQLFDWTNQLSLAAAISDPDLGLAALMEIGGYLTETIAARKAEPTVDLISMMLQAEVDGDRLTDMEVSLFFGLLMFAGNDTTRNTASGGMRALIETSDQRRKLIADRSLIPNAVEECLRWVTPIVYFARVAQTDTEVCGHPIKEGERVAMWYPAGSRDPEKIPDPHKFDITREKTPHQAFGGGGPHFCIGNALARLELRLLFEALIERLPDMEFAGPIERLVSSFSNELTSMPVVFTPARTAR